MHNMTYLSTILAIAVVIITGFGYPEEQSTQPCKGIDTNIEQNQWQTAFNKIDQNQKTLTKKLIDVAKDQDKQKGLRRKAIEMLGEMKNDESELFLIENVLLRIPDDSISTEDTGEDFPCIQALRRGDWQTAYNILYATKVKKTREDLIYLAAIIKRIMNTEIVLVAIDNIVQQKASKNDVWKKNLTHIKTFVMQ